MSLYGIETDDECWSKIDELLELTHRAQKTRSKEAVATLKKGLKEYYDLGNTISGKSRMSPVERAFFWPSISEAYVCTGQSSTRRKSGTKTCLRLSIN